MNAAPAILLIVLTAYLLGSIPFGLLVGRARGVDIREQGSRNIGATNVWRVLGRKWGLITFFGDTAKGWLAVVAGFWIATQWPGAFRDSAYAGIFAAVGCILGHNFPIWLRFKGGKGVATSLGVIFGMMPLASVIIFAIWGVVCKATRYVSLASIVAAMSLPVAVALLRFFGRYGDGHFYFACAAALLVIVRHLENIKRLVAGTENRFSATPTAEPPPPAADPV